MLTEKQQFIISYLKEVGQASTIQILAAAPFSYYCNGEKHLGEILSRMIKKRLLVRVGRGKYKLQESTEIQEENNIEIF
jgi:predicted transcriptional regulator of viral defense system